jgi:hypothetical protein
MVWARGDEGIWCAMLRARWWWCLAAAGLQVVVMHEQKLMSVSMSQTSVCMRFSIGVCVHVRELFLIGYFEQ